MLDPEAEDSLILSRAGETCITTISTRLNWCEMLDPEAEDSLILSRAGETCITTISTRHYVGELSSLSANYGAPGGWIGANIDYEIIITSFSGQWGAGRGLGELGACGGAAGGGMAGGAAGGVGAGGGACAGGAGGAGGGAAAAGGAGGGAGGGPVEGGGEEMMCMIKVYNKKNNCIQFELPLASCTYKRIVKEVAEGFKLERSFTLKYLNGDREEILFTRDKDFRLIPRTRVDDGAISVKLFVS